MLLLCFTSFPLQLNRQKNLMHYCNWSYHYKSHFYTISFTFYVCVVTVTRLAMNTALKFHYSVFSTGFLFLSFFTLLFVSCTLHCFLSAHQQQKCCFFFLFFCASVHGNWSVIVCVSCTFCKEQKWTKVPARSQHLHRCTVYLQLNL